MSPQDGRLATLNIIIFYYYFGHREKIVTLKVVKANFSKQLFQFDVTAVELYFCVRKSFDGRLFWGVIVILVSCIWKCLNRIYIFVSRSHSPASILCDYNSINDQTQKRKGAERCGETKTKKEGRN